MTASLIHTDFIRQHPAQAVLTVLGLSAVVLIFLPFSTRAVLPVPIPWNAFLGSLGDHKLFWYIGPGNTEFFWFLAPCVVLPFAIFTGYLRWLLTGHLSRLENGMGYALALISAFGAPIAFAFLYDWGWPPGHYDWVFLSFLISFLMPFAAAAWCITPSLRNRMSPVPMALVAMQLVYLVFALHWVTFLTLDVIEKRQSLDEVRSGGYLAYVTVLAYTAQAVALARGQSRKLLRLVPLALVWVLSVALWVWVWI